MSENIKESIPTSEDPRSKRPTKKRALTPISGQAAQVEALFARPEKEIKIPSGPLQKTLAPPPEIVANVQGSSAGAGSGEFHVYKASRRREYERLRRMDEEVRKEEEAKEFDLKREEARKADEEKTSKNRARRERQKQRKSKQKGGNGMTIPVDDDVDAITAANNQKMRANPTMARAQDEANDKDNNRPVGSNAEEIGIIIHDED